MKTKLLLLLILVISCGVSSGQAPVMQANANPQQIAIKKQIIVNDLENQIKETPLAAVRVLARYRIAAWLWRDGKDETGLAEQVAVKALDEIYEKRSEIPDSYFNSLSSQIFALLETNAKESAKKLRAKYSLSSEDELNNAYSLLKMKDGEKAAADKIQKSLLNKTELSSMTVWLLDELRDKRSPELLRLLTDIVTLEESGQSNFSAESLFFVIDFFRDTMVSRDLQIRFYKIIFNKARVAVQSPDSDAKSIYDLLHAVTQDIAKNAPALLPEANTLQYVFRSRLPLPVAEATESYRRIEENSDRLSALISEAEASNNEGLKADLLSQAAQLALEKGKFRLAVELSEKIKAHIDEEKDKRFPLWHDQFLSEVSEQALKADDMDSAKYAADQVSNKIVLASILRKTAVHYYEKRDLALAVAALDHALKLTTNADNDVWKIYLLINLIATAQKIDPGRVHEVIEKTAQAINAIPRPAVDDKPETDSYKKYVSSVIAINERLTPVLYQLVRANKNEALDLAARVEAKEIKLMLNYAFLTDSLRAETEAR